MARTLPGYESSMNDYFGSLGLWALFGFLVLMVFLWLTWAAVRSADGRSGTSSIGFPSGFSGGRSVSGARSYGLGSASLTYRSPSRTSRQRGARPLPYS